MSESPLQKEAHSGLIYRYRYAFIVAFIFSLFVGAASYLVYKTLEHSVTLLVDGKCVRINTFSKTVEGTLKESGVRLGAADLVKPGLQAAAKDGLRIKVVRAFPVSITMGEKTLNVLTVDGRVSKILSANHITVRRQDKVFPPMDSKVGSDGRIRVMRIDETTFVKQVQIPFSTSKRPDKGLDRGKSKLLAPGTAGLVAKTYKIKFVDGKEVQKQLIETRTIRQAVPRVVSYGVRIPLGTLVTSRGTYRYRRLHNMTATAYTSRGGRSTATGRRAGYGVVAVDPKVIPLHSKVYIEGYGHAVAGDTGGAIKGERIDLGFESHSDAVHFGRRRVKVYVLK